MTGIAERFWPKVERGAGCWEWRGSRHGKGYGHFRVGRDVKKAHRVAWELSNGPIPDGIFIDHICHNHGCVNPSHLRLATPQQNSQYKRGVRSDNKSGVRGVYWVPKLSKWAAHVKVDGRLKVIGYYADLNEAEREVKAARAKYYDFPEYEENR